MQSFKDIQFIIRAIKIIVQQEVEYTSKNLNTTIIYKSLKISISNNKCKIDDGYKIYTVINVRHLLMSILVEATEREGLIRFHDRCLKFKEMHHSEQKYITLLSSPKLFSISAPEIYNTILYTNTTTKQTSVLFNMKHSLIKEIRSKNRKAITVNIINEVLTKKTELYSF